MSYEHGTTHYNLPLTEGNDKRDWFDTNQAFEDVDAALFAAIEAAGTASADVEQIKTDVTALQGRMTTAETDIDNVEASQATQAEQIINLTNRVNSVVVQTENKFNSVAVADAYDPSSTYSVDDYCTYDGNLYQCITAITTGEPFDADKWVAVDLITLIGGSGTTPTAADVSLAPITGMTATNVQNGIAEHQIDINQINADLDDLTTVVSVTANGTETYGDLISRLSNAIDRSKLTFRSVVRLADEIYHITQWDSKIFTLNAYPTVAWGYEVNITNNTYRSINTAGSPIDLTTNIPTAGTVLSLMY